MMKHMRKTLVPLLLLSCSSHAADFVSEDEQPPGPPTPWLTGPLLSETGYVIPQGHWDFNPYQYITTYFGAYDEHWHASSVKHNFYELNTQLLFYYGFANRFDFVIVPAFSWNHTAGASHWVLNDLDLWLDYQLLNEKKGYWWPSIKLTPFISFPIGRYQKLNPKSKQTDIGGTGSWQPGISIAFSRLYWWGGHHYFAPNLNFNYIFPTPVHVKGLNAYGGGHHTQGKVYPGQYYSALFGFELSLTQNWGLACDLEYLHVNKTRFKGHPGKSHGHPNEIGFPSSERWSLAPAIEYCWSENLGLIAGVWFTLAGRNTDQFASAIIALEIYK